MKASLLATLALVGSIVGVSATAGVILPNMYASEYCSFRNLGVSEDEAMTAAMDASYIDSGTTVQVTIDGVLYDADVVRAIRAAGELCPGM